MTDIENLEELDNGRQTRKENHIDTKIRNRYN